MPEQNATAITQLTAAVDMLVSQFIHPAVQQADSNRQSLDRVVKLMDRHAEAIVEIDDRLEIVTNQLASVSESLAAFDQRLEETRSLVAENGSMIAQLGVKQTANAEAISRLESTQADNAEAISRLESTQAENANQVQALMETSRTQLAAIIGNGRRIDRLEQQAS